MDKAQHSFLTEAKMKSKKNEFSVYSVITSKKQFTSAIEKKHSVCPHTSNAQFARVLYTLTITKAFIFIFAHSFVRSFVCDDVAIVVVTIMRKPHNKHQTFR